LLELIEKKWRTDFGADAARDGVEEHAALTQSIAGLYAEWESIQESERL
jgi:hypothetical protein